MNVDLYERIWMWGITVMLALFFGSVAAAAFGRQIHPPSHVETIDPKAAFADPRFKPQGVSTDAEGRVQARVFGMMFAWLPSEITVPANTPVTFHLTSTDVTHGFEIVRTNGQSMVVPGYISQFTTEFTQPGEYLIACNEYCGVGHHLMAGKLRVVPRDQWPAGATAQAAAAPAAPATAESEHGHGR
jgi:cytochrome c oxidase subunit 2